MATTRKPATPPKFTPKQLETAIKADNQKRREKAAAKRAEKKAAEDAKIKATRVEAVMKAEAYQAARDFEAEHAAYVEALRIDFEAEHGERTSYKADGSNSTAFETFVEDNILTGYDVDAPKAKPAREKTYFGRMLALRDAAKTYVKAKNGILCNGDWLAITCGVHSRDEVVKRLGELLFNAKLTESTNPYKHLNPGQQSMNLRNKARAAVKAGTLTEAQVKTALK